jgi:hypothetical protein
MAAQNDCLIHAPVGKEAIGGLGVCPVLEGLGHTGTLAERNLLQQLLQSFAMAGIGKLTSGNLILDPAIANFQRLCTC